MYPIDQIMMSARPHDAAQDSAGAETCESPVLTTLSSNCNPTSLAHWLRTGLLWMHSALYSMLHTMQAPDYQLDHASNSTHLIRTYEQHTPTANAHSKDKGGGTCCM